ncbi:inorganic phosphate transporter [Polaribacter sp. BAL334]|uniref:inorganic phosphate transporter n=1 Tax=Polaribacter sp. BAL334 TaxID=1708178 RepID=UPI0018D23963|nr:inorganic phosphate transporter [Polaribacter sp. BAL334]MBG7613629.1 inorganic phosphate transporter [Polaribacter sp. BAL334]
MSDPYILMLVALGILAIVDLIVGVSNDAVNFLNSAIGSKAISIRNIMIIASIGVFVGAVTSSGMMEVARKGIFNPDMFVFQDVMMIFMAVMITDILLLDVFNSLGMPTSTTVSVIFELLGAAFVIAVIKITNSTTENLSSIWNYINYETATEIVVGILLSVVVAFTVGAVVQYFSRLIYTFNFETRPAYIHSLFGGFAITAITYFIVIKGLQGTEFYSTIKGFLSENNTLIILGNFVFWTLFSYFFVGILKKNILVLIIGVGTFSLAMAFSGNDLVNFIGVPIAALNSYQAWQVSGVAPNAFYMNSLAEEVPSNLWFLLIAGTVMVVTLWTSSKAKSVIETGVNLSRQGEGHEKFQPNNLSRVVVRFSMYINSGINYVIPLKTQEYLNSKFEKPIVKLPKDKTYEMPAFDMVRASVNLVMASALISIATSMKLPLSTTYVTFMVAMGSSLADRAWGRESAVYRVAGVLNVIGGWFLTAIIAFVAASIVAYFIQLNMAFIPVLLIIVIILLTKNTIAHRKKSKEIQRRTYIERSELITINGVIEESSDHISEVAIRINKLYTNVVDDLAKHDLNKLRKTDKFVSKLNDEIDDLKDNVFYFIKSLDETSVQASKFYIMVLGYLQDAAQSISYVSRASFKHVNNNHKNLKRGQIKDLKEINIQLTSILGKVSTVFKKRDFDNLNDIIKEKNQLLLDVSTSVEKQVARIRTDETSAKNTTLYFSILLETKDLIKALMSLLETYEEFHLSAKEIK